MSSKFGTDPIPALPPTSDLNHLTSNNARLCIISGPQAGITFRLDQIRLVVGRNSPPAVQVDIDLTPCELSSPPMISRRHAELQWVEGELQITDLSSKNGTWVDGEQLTSPAPGLPSAPKVLTTNSKIKFANLETQVVVDGD
ncbi:MAG: FHA domain-containing protein [Abitibacteriaceae bacterium]|nr:FHA domain-containing protein [Abditibacteriaceae bacterium]